MEYSVPVTDTGDAPNQALFFFARIVYFLLWHFLLPPGCPQLQGAVLAGLASIHVCAR